MKKAFFLWLILSFSYLLSAQVPGTMDFSFGDMGKVIFPTPTGSATMVSLRLGSDGKIYVCGAINNPPEVGLFVAKYTFDGLPDNTFSNGKNYFTFSFNYGTGGALKDMLIRSDGKILVVGNAWDNGDETHPAIARFLADGSPDPNFGYNGQLVLTGFNATIERATFLYNYNFVLAGTSHTGNAKDLILISLYSGGSINSNFGNNGSVVLDLNNNSFDIPGSIHFFNSKLIVSSAAASYPYDAIVLTAFLENGQPDVSFGTNGKAIYEGLKLYDSPLIGPVTKHRMDGMGRIWVASRNYGLNGYSSMLLRFLPNGIPDNSFGDYGLKLYDFGENSQSWFADLGIQLDGKVALAGGWRSMGVRKTLFARVDADGNLDPSVGENNAGYVLHSIQTGGELGDRAYYLSITYPWEEKVLLGGECSLPSDFGIYITRLFLGSSVGVESTLLRRDVRLYAMKYHVKLFLDENVKLKFARLYNSEGKMLKEYIATNVDDFQGEVYLKFPWDLQKDLYFLQVSTSTGNYHFKFIKP